MNLYIFIISVVRPAGTRNPPEIRGCGCGCRNAPAGLLAGGFFPIPRVCLRAGFRQTRTRTHGCHPYVRSLSIRRCFPAGSFIVYKASRVRHAAQDGDKNLCYFAGEEVGFRQAAPAADGEEDREFARTVQ